MTKSLFHKNFSGPSMSMGVLLSLLFIVPTSYSQNQATKKEQRDTLVSKLARDSTRIYRKTFAKPYIKVENRNSFFSTQSVNLYGFMLGATLREKHILCAGVFVLDRRSKEPIMVIEDADDTKQYLALNYFNYCYQYIFYNARFLQVNIPFEIGYGNYRVRVTDNQDVHLRTLKGDFIPIGAGVQCILKPIRWGGFSISGGYRYVKEEEIRQIKLNFRGWFYSVGVWVDARQVYRHGKYYLAKRRFRRNVDSL